MCRREILGRRPAADRHRLARSDSGQVRAADLGSMLHTLLIEVFWQRRRGNATIQRNAFADARGTRSRVEFAISIEPDRLGRTCGSAARQRGCEEHPSEGRGHTRRDDSTQGMGKLMLELATRLAAAARCCERETRQGSGPGSQTPRSHTPGRLTMLRLQAGSTQHLGGGIGRCEARHYCSGTPGASELGT